MDRTEAIENLMRIRHMHDQRVFGAINDEEDEALGMAIEALVDKDTNVPNKSALDHIHNVISDEYKRGYEHGVQDATEIYLGRWTPVTEKLPEEHDTMFAKYWGTDRWNEYMFRGRSELVEVTVELEDGTRYTDASRTRDGKWDIEMNHGAVKKKVVAWKPMSAPWRGNVDAEVQNDKN